jgi:hypothetical protein
LDEGKNKILPKYPIEQDFSYVLNQWFKLIRYVKDSRLEIANELSERTIKQHVIGRKNWLFYNLRHVLTVIQNVETELELELLIPYNITPDAIFCF